MTTEIQSKDERLEARVSKLVKEKLKRAAALQGRTLTEFVVSAVLEKADHVIESHELIVLGTRDRKVLFEALRNPPEPNDALRKAFELNGKLISPLSKANG